jgi:hypothetical protein
MLETAKKIAQMSIPSFVQPGTTVVYSGSRGDALSRNSSADTLIVLLISPTAAIVREVFQQSGATTVSDHTFVPGHQPATDTNFGWIRLTRPGR